MGRFSEMFNVLVAFAAAVLTTVAGDDKLPEIHWMAPFLSGGGYSSEAIAFLTALDDDGLEVTAEQHGDGVNQEFVQGMPGNLRARIYAKLGGSPDLDNTVVVCHSEPGAWHPCRWTTRCPLVGAGYTIGRTMFETDRLPRGWETRCNGHDEVWVPTEFHRRIFEDAGVSKEKLWVLAEPVDTAFYRPGVPPLMLEELPFAQHEKVHVALSKCKFKFLSIFKWERRKGFDILLEAFLREFDAKDGACLFIRAAQYHGDITFDNEVSSTLQKHHLSGNERGSIFLIDHAISGDDLPRLYAAADAFVLPSRGEGWGRPHVEAMACGLPVIATNWSGPTEYLTDENSFPLSFNGLEEITEGAFRGHMWASPSVDHLRQLMRYVMEHPDLAKQRGDQARQDMVTRFEPQRLADSVRGRLQHIQNRLQQKRLQAAEVTKKQAEDRAAELRCS